MRSGSWSIRRWHRQRALPAWSPAWRPCTRCLGMRAMSFSPGALLLMDTQYPIQPCRLISALWQMCCAVPCICPVENQCVLSEHIFCDDRHF